MKGITLVALVVTIVVLLILAGITIATLFGENGIITKAQQAADATKNAQDNTEQELQDLENYIDITLDTSELGQLINSGKKAENTTTVKDKTGKLITIPGGFTVTNITNEVDKGIVIKDENNNEFVWVPVPDITTMYDEVNNAGQLYDFTATEMNKRAYPTTQNSGCREPDILK